MNIDKNKLTHVGSMNYILQVFSEKDSDEVIVDQYQPRKNRVWNGEMTKQEAREGIEETIERMKIAITLFQEYLDGKRDHVYYWELKDEKL